VTGDVATLSENPSRFEVPGGCYSLRIAFTNGQTWETDGVVSVSGETVERVVDVPCGLVTVQVTGAGHHPGAGPYPYVEVLRDGRMLTALADNPARFSHDGRDLHLRRSKGRRLDCPRTVTVCPGSETSLLLDLGPSGGLAMIRWRSPTVCGSAFSCLDTPGMSGLRGSCVGRRDPLPRATP